MAFGYAIRVHTSRKDLPRRTSKARRKRVAAGIRCPRFAASSCEASAGRRCDDPPTRRARPSIPPWGQQPSVARISNPAARRRRTRQWFWQRIRDYFQRACLRPVGTWLRCTFRPGPLCPCLNAYPSWFSLQISSAMGGPFDRRRPGMWGCFPTSQKSVESWWCQALSCVCTG